MPGQMCPAFFISLNTIGDLAISKYYSVAINLSKAACPSGVLL